MPSTQTSDVQRAAREYRASLLRREAASRRLMASEWDTVRRGLSEEIDGLLREIERRGVTSANQLYRLERFQSFYSYADSRMTGYSAKAHAEAVELTRFAASFGAQTAAALVAGEATGISAFLTQPDPRALEYLVGRVKFGKAAERFVTVPHEATDKVVQELVKGVGTGRHSTRTARAMRQAADMTGYNAQRIARTESLTAYRSAALDVYRESGVVTAWRWEASLDDRCCFICIAMHGTITPVGDTFDTHVNCRCSPTPITLSWDEILNGGLENEGWDTTTGSDWFAGQGAERQREILWPGRLEKYEAGTPLSDMQRRTSDPVWGGGRTSVPLRDL